MFLNDARLMRGGRKQTESCCGAECEEIFLFSFSEGGSLPLISKSRSSSQLKKTSQSSAFIYMMQSAHTATVCSGLLNKSCEQTDGSG